jgi:hypothetical protein
MVAESGIWLIESPVSMVAGEQIAYSVDWQGATYVSEPAVQVYKNGADITELALAGDDEHVVTGNVLTLKKLHAAESDGGASYVLVISATVDGNRERRKLLVQLAKPAAEG